MARFASFGGRGVRRSTDNLVRIVARGLYALAFASGFVVDSRKDREQGMVARSFSKTTALVCLLLTLWAAWAFVSHHHSSEIEADQCAVCLAAHSAAPQAPTTVVTSRFVVVATFRSEPIQFHQRLAVFALSVRPPPNV